MFKSSQAPFRLSTILRTLIFSKFSQRTTAAMLHPPTGPTPCSSKMMSAHHLEHDGFRSLPGTPLGTDPRMMNLDLATGLDQARCGLSAGGYFDSGSRCGMSPLRPRTPYANDYDLEGDYRYNSSYNSGSSQCSETNAASMYPIVCR